MNVKILSQHVGLKFQWFINIKSRSQGGIFVCVLARFIFDNVFSIINRVTLSHPVNLFNLK